jgi:hypothetical protein
MLHGMRSTLRSLRFRVQDLAKPEPEKIAFCYFARSLSGSVAAVA